MGVDALELLSGQATAHRALVALLDPALGDALRSLQQLASYVSFNESVR